MYYQHYGQKSHCQWFSLSSTANAGWEISSTSGEKKSWCAPAIVFTVQQAAQLICLMVECPPHHPLVLCGVHPIIGEHHHQLLMGGLAGHTPVYRMSDNRHKQYKMRCSHLQVYNEARHSIIDVCWKYQIVSPEEPRGLKLQTCHIIGRIVPSVLDVKILYEYGTVVEKQVQTVPNWY